MAADFLQVFISAWHSLFGDAAGLRFIELRHKFFEARDLPIQTLHFIDHQIDGTTVLEREAAYA